ncbi:hypothetical protein Q7P37_009477 [Cladosporium fusiforme]
MVGVALISWSCGHFVTKPSEQQSEALIASAEEEFWHLQDTADDDLANLPTNRHIISESHCPKCQEPVEFTIWKSRAQADINSLRYLHGGCQETYLEIAAKYFQLDFSQKARFANDDRCAPAHDQFWVSKTPRKADPFFAPIENISRLCDQAQEMVDASKNVEDIKSAYVHINNARAEMGRMMMPLDNLLTGVELMASRRSRGRDNATGRNGLASMEAITSVSKAMNFFERMDDWHDDAMEAVVRLFQQ